MTGILRGIMMNEKKPMIFSVVSHESTRDRMAAMIGGMNTAPHDVMDEHLGDPVPVPVCQWFMSVPDKWGSVPCTSLEVRECARD